MAWISWVVLLLLEKNNDKKKKKKKKAIKSSMVSLKKETIIWVFKHLWS